VADVGGSRSTSGRPTASRRCSRAHHGAARLPTATLYRALRALNPSPYMYHLVLDGVELVGARPELLVRVGRRR
jgi:anthranilate/para-aminobenzoate synthase component I